jgi:hypothetical protein
MLVVTVHLPRSPTGKWWQHGYIVKLNLLLVIPLITSYANGFDGSMMNGLQSVERWQEVSFSAKPLTTMFLVLSSIATLLRIILLASSC